MMPSSPSISTAGSVDEPGLTLHLVSLSFDDGFVDSFPRIADIYEARGLTACLNIVATRPGPGYAADAEGVPELPLTDFALWNQLAARGHEIMPHSYCHKDLRRVSLETAAALIDRGLQIIAEHLDGYDATRAIYNFAYNGSTPQIEALLAGKVRAWRTGGGQINPMPGAATRRITTSGHGPENCEADLDRKLAAFLASEGGWFVYNLHGLDQEGWGPVRATYLADLLDRLLDCGATIRAVGQALSEAAESTAT